MKLALAAVLLMATPALASQVTASRAALATAHPLATKVGLSVLQRGGNAIDASVAVAFALAVVQPQAGNLGGGGFLIYYEASTRAVWTLDFRETAPAGSKRDMFATGSAGVTHATLLAGVPATVAGLDAMHRRFGSRPWKELVEPAASVAHDGFLVDAQLARAVEQTKVALPATAGKMLTQNELAATLRRIADNGARDFYAGDTAKKLVEGVRASGGNLSFRDLRDYKPLWRAPLKLRYGAFDIYTLGPPSAGGIVMGEALNILAGDDLAAAGFQTPKALHLIVEAQRRASIDGAKYVADPLTSRVPYRELLSATRAQAWRKSIDPLHVIATSQLTEPVPLNVASEHTTHFTIVDAAGNIAAVTTSLGDDFGSGFLAPNLGFFLNAAMRDFTSGGNAIEPGRRPLSLMSPTIVLRDERPYLALGSRGGAAIPTTILQVFLNLAVYGKSLGDAIAAPRWHQQATPEGIAYESGASSRTVDALNALGHGVTSREGIGDVQAILFDGKRIIAVADPRHGGSAGGF